MEVTQNYTKKPEMPPVTFVGSLCKIHVLLFSKIADVHEVRTWKSVCYRKIFRFSLHNTRDVTKGARFLGAESLRGSKSSSNVMSTFFQNSTFASERPQVRTWGCQTCFMSRAPSNLVTPLHDAHHDCLAKMAKFVYINTRPSVANYQSQNFWNKMLLMSKSFNHRKYLEGRKKVYFENKHNFPPKKMLGLREKTNIPKNAKAIIMLALYPEKCLLHHKGIENDQTIFVPRHSAKCEVCCESMTKFSSIQFFVWNVTISR